VEVADSGHPRNLRLQVLDYYAVLGVNPGAEDIVIRAAYKALAQRYHPDRYPGSKDEAHRRMSELTQAYEVLADPVRRPKYDRRRTLYTRAVAARVNHARRFASALHPRELRSIREIRGKYRAALAALMGAVVVLSIFNLFHHSARIKEWIGFDPPEAARPVGETRAIVSHPAPPASEPALSTSAPTDTPSPAARSPMKEKKRSNARSAANSRSASSAPAATTASPCDDVAAALGLCTRDKPGSR
jgi:curved DNA-binding protein CbpA